MSHGRLNAPLKQAAVIITCGFLLSSCLSVSQNTRLSALSPPALCQTDCTDQGISKSDWWQVFQDPELDQLMIRFEKGNFQLRSICADWNASIKDRVKYAIGGKQAEIEMTETINQLRLTLQSQLVQSYFSVRFIDAEVRILNEALKTRESDLRLANQRYDTGLTSEFDVEEAKAELAATEADLDRMSVPRKQLGNGIASLIGCDPACFTIQASDSYSYLPSANGCVPFAVLGNRPDVAADIARLKLANCRIGIEKRVFFPQTNLMDHDCRCRDESSSFLSWSCRNLQAKQTIAKSGDARADQRKALVDYQKTMLTAQREVNDALVKLLALSSEKKAQSTAVNSAKRIATLSKQQKEEGMISSTQAVNASRGYLAAERRLVQIRSQQYVATVELIEALGGGCATEYFSSK